MSAVTLGLVPALAIAFSVMVSGDAPATSPSAAAESTCGTTLPLVWLNEADASPYALAAAEREAGGIWAEAGIHLAWAYSRPPRVALPDDVYVVVRTQLARHPGDAAQAGRRHTLGRVVRVAIDQPSRLIELSLPGITTSVMSQSVFGRPASELPSVARDLVVGRSLGRVAAHEIGHWLFGRGHAPDGLMKAVISHDDLVGLEAPALPADWPDRALAQLRLRRPCLS